MSVKLLTKQHLEFLTLKGGCTGLSESTLVKMPHCWKSHVTAHVFYFQLLSQQVTAFGLSGIKCHIYVSGEGEDL